jgi:hypothetical protein
MAVDAGEGQVLPGLGIKKKREGGKCVFVILLDIAQLRFIPRSVVASIHS